MTCKEYFWEISFLNLAQQTSSKFSLIITWNLPYQHRSFSQQCERIPIKKKQQQQQQLKHFLAVSCWSQIENLIGFSPLGRDISQLVNLSRESQVTRTTSIYRGKRVIYHGKSVPCNRTYYRKSSRSLYSDHVFLLFISFYAYNTEHLPLSCTHLLLIPYSTFQRHST